MEDHVKNKDRLLKEWEALCSYQAEPSTVSIAQNESNIKKNRCPDAVPCEPSEPNIMPYYNEFPSEQIPFLFYAFAPSKQCIVPWLFNMWTKPIRYMR